MKEQSMGIEHSIEQQKQYHEYEPVESWQGSVDFPQDTSIEQAKGAIKSLVEKMLSEGVQIKFSGRFTETDRQLRYTTARNSRHF